MRIVAAIAAVLLLAGCAPSKTLDQKVDSCVTYMVGQGHTDRAIDTKACLLWHEQKPASFEHYFGS